MEIDVVGFDADDTLWVNENYFREAESRFADFFKNHYALDFIEETLYETEIQNLALYGYGIKGFTLSMIEAANKITGGNVPSEIISELVQIGKEMLDKPVVLLDNVKEILETLKPKYRLILVTKGDLLDQHRKLKKSGLESYFHHIEVMNEKKPEDYQKLVKHLDLNPAQFIMIGNSLKSDVMPVLEIGSQAIYVPYEITWQHEHVEEELLVDSYIKVPKLHDILKYL